MRYRDFETTVQQRGYTFAQLRCDVRPSDEILDLIDSVGANYEAYVRLFIEKTLDNSPKYRNKRRRVDGRA